MLSRVHQEGPSRQCLLRTGHCGAIRFQCEPHFAAGSSIHRGSRVIPCGCAAFHDQAVDARRVYPPGEAGSRRRARRVARAMLGPSRLALLLASAIALGCAHAGPEAAAPVRRGLSREGTPAEVDIALARGRGRERSFAWASWSTETFDRARRGKRLILLDGAAAWCHWCHVMDETTYVDPDVGRLISE